MSIPLKSTQIVAATAVVLALLGGAYAVGRSQSAEPVITAADPAATAAQVEAATRANTVAQLSDTPAPAKAAPRAQAPARPATQPRSTAAMCESCARVTEVHTETRRGQASGVGAVGGAVVGGLLGNMVGGGTGKKIATVGGAVAGGYAGNEIEKNQKSHTVWVVQVRDRDGQTRRFERSADPGLRVGDEVRLTDNGFVRS
jgi:outer membrane lipoprotein SlyB